MNPVAETEQTQVNRRDAIKTLFALAAAFATSGCSQDWSALQDFFGENFKEMTADEIKKRIADWEEKYSKEFNRPVKVGAEPPLDGVLFGYALDISRCIGCRRCVYACVKENNQSRDPKVQWITVLQMDKERGIDLEHSDAYYDPETVPQEGKFYMPVACQHCENPPCVKVCPVEATWKEKDGIVVIDYDWCVGCRCCITACPYGARHFNWKTPALPSDELNPDMHYLGNRPRPRGVVEKCSFCIQRTRKGRYPACVEVCPVGARKFGNLLDPKSEIRYIIENKRVFVLKEELNTQPKFFYYFSM